MPMLDPKITRGGVVRSQIVGDQLLRQEAIFLQKLAHQFQRRGLIPLGLDQDIQNLSFAIDGAPEINQASINLQIESSGAGEFHPHALSEPDVILSHHPAPIVRPCP